MVSRLETFSAVALDEIGARAREAAARLARADTDTKNRALREAAEKMGQVEADFAEAGNNMNDMIGSYADSAANLDDSIDEIKQLLRIGFRLPEPERSRAVNE